MRLQNRRSTSPLFWLGLTSQMRITFIINKVYIPIMRHSATRLVDKRDIDLEIREEKRTGYLICKGTMMDTVHLLTLYLKINPADRKITDAEFEMTNYPFQACPLVESKVKGLKGIVLGRGVIKEISKKVGGQEGCVHLRELAIDLVNKISGVLMTYEPDSKGINSSFHQLPEKERSALSSHILKNTCHIYKEK